jgi:hypothetical protein
MTDYSGCGTFFGRSKDPVKRACYLEKRIAKSQPKCLAGKQKHCDKVTRWRSEIATITGVSPVAQGTAADYLYQQALAKEQYAVSSYMDQEKTAMDRLLPVVAVGITGLIILYAANEFIE